MGAPRVLCWGVTSYAGTSWRATRLNAVCTLHSRTTVPSQRRMGLLRHLFLGSISNCLGASFLLIVARSAFALLRLRVYTKMTKRFLLLPEARGLAKRLPGISEGEERDVLRTRRTSCR